MNPALDWYPRATSHWRDWDVAALRTVQGNTRISVVVPARNEAATIRDVVSGIRTLLRPDGIVDELVVIDSDSTDETARIVRDEGVPVYAAREIRPDLGTFAGKGEALWKSTFVTTGDVLVFIDADLTEWGPHFVTGLLGPILTQAGVRLVKGYYDRILDDGSGTVSTEGGRVTELLARPVLNLRWPDLSHVVQPLAGEWAIRRDTFQALSVPVGYGVEFATLVDVYRRHGLGAIAQVDLGERAHRHQSVHDLGVMATEILAVAGRRIEAAGGGAGARGGAPGAVLWHYERGRVPEWAARPVPTAERPPAG